MDWDTFKSILDVGETVTTEFKRCGGRIEDDTYESVCAFLNRFGGDLFLGVLDDGTVAGVAAAADLIRNFIKTMGNPQVFSPTVYLSPEIIEDEAGHAVIHIHVPPSAEVHSYRKVIYDRVDDADVKVTATSQIAAMYIRKQNIFTERKIYPYVAMEDLRLDLLPGIRQMAVNHGGGSHPWEKLEDFELLKSAGLYGMDRVTGKMGYNLAAVMLLGKDEVIRDVCPAYETDALVRKVNADRYDDRELIRTNLIESYEALMEFAKKHLPDKFFLEDDRRISLRNILAREMLSNTLMHREFTSSYMAKFVICKEEMYVENANRASKEGLITPDNLEPAAKNPVIADFFRNIGWADRLGSGVRNLYKYSRFYSGRDPKLIEGDVFRIIVPLDEGYSYDYDHLYKISPIGLELSAGKTPVNADKMPKSNDKTSITADKTSISADKISSVTDTDQRSGKDIQMFIERISATRALTEQQKRVLTYVMEYERITSKETEAILGIKQRRARDILKEMAEKNILVKQGNYKNTFYTPDDEWMRNAM